MSDQHLIGTEGDDFLFAGDGNDLLEARGGNDVLSGGLGDDVYEMGPGMGYDIVTDTGGNDEIRFGPGVVADELIRWRDVNGDLTLYVPNSADMVRITGWFNSPDNQVERFVFDDGTVWTAAEAQSLRLLGTTGDDNFGGSDFGETIYARGGNDVLAGGLGDDVYDMGPGMGYDLVLDSGGDDEVRLGSGVAADDLARFRDWNGDLVFYRPNSGDMLRIAGWFNSPDNQIERVVFDDGTVWNAAESSALRMFGTEFNDYLYGSQYGERLEGRGGSDQMYGFEGDDVYVPGPLGAPFTSADYIFDSAGNDELRLEGVNAADVQRMRVGDDLWFSTSSQGLLVRFGNWFTTADNQIERVVFDDGTVWNAAESSALRMFGTEFNDYLYGSQYGERLEGRGGSDQMYGFEGDDVYVPGPLGAPFTSADYIFDSAGNDELRLEGVNAADVQRMRVGDDLWFSTSSQGLLVRFGNWFTTADNQIERVVFDDGTVWNAAESSALRMFGTEFNDYLYGSQYGERLEGRGGSDQMYGFEGDDVYVPGPLGAPFTSADYIFDSAGNDELRLEGVNAADVQRMRVGDDLWFSTSSQGLLVRFGNWFTTADNQIERVVFDDGTVWNAAESSALRMFGTEFNDYLYGSQYGERLEGRGGSDQMYGFEGDDVYVPGPLGAPFTSADYIYDSAGNDELRLDGVDPADVQRQRVGDDLWFSTSSQGLLVRFGNWFAPTNQVSVWNPSPDYQIERVVFDDGTVWNAAQSSALRIIGTEFDDFLYGSSYGERIEGRGGNDRLDGGGGADVLVGGTGDDVYVINYAGATVVEDADAGNDTVESSIQSFTLASNVETLVLMGSAWQGVGNEGGNTIVGNEASNYILGAGGTDVLYGAGGNDILNGGTGDDMLLGGFGNDWLEGGAGNDIYVRYDETGSDLISDTASAGAGNQLYLAAHRSNEVQLDYNGMFLELKTLSGELLVSLTGFSHLDALSSFRAVEEFRFSDGIVIGYEQLLSRGFDIHGTGNVSEDYVEGTNIQDRIYGSGQGEGLIGYAGDDWLNGGGGDDTLQGMEGNDNLYGGTGDDELYGGVGSDTYYFDRIGGHDRILELVELADDHGDVDTLWFDWDILPQDLTASIDSLGRLVLGINGSDATLTFNEWFNTELSTHVELFRFLSDGTVLTDDDITALLNDAPVLASPIADQMARDTVPFSFTIPDGTFFDDDIGDTLTYAATLPGGGALPSWLSFDAATHTFSGTPGMADAGVAFAVEVVATDSYGESASDQFLIGVLRAPNQTLVGTAGDDVLVGASGDDVLRGLEGNDALDAGSGNDWLYAGAGDDTLFGGDGDDHMFGEAGTDYLFGGAGNDWMDGGDGLDFLYGGDGDDRLTDASVMEGGAGNDELAGGGLWHDAMLRGGDGDDVIHSGSGNDFIWGDAGNDRLYGGGGRDEIYGGDGDDWMYEASVMYGGAGNDWLEGDSTHDNTLYGEAGNDTLLGGDANDYLDGGTGSDRLEGGLGNDTYVLEAGDSITERTGEGIDTVMTPFSYTIVAQFISIENVTLTGTAAVNATGDNGDNVLKGNSAANILNGGAGNDTYYVGAGDTIVDSSGTELVYSDITWSLQSGLENLTLIGTGAINGTGNSSANILTGNSAANVLTGGAGNDSYYVGAGDTVVETSGGGTDTVFADVDWTLGDNLERLTLIGTAYLARGNSLNNTINGNGADNYIDGGDGNDTMIGGAGNDTFIVDQAGDSVSDNSGNDTVIASISFTLNSNIEKLVLVGSADLTGQGAGNNNVLIGNAGNNTLAGGVGSDIIDGGAGNDRIEGDAGTDTLTGGAGSDSFVFENIGTGHADTVTDFEAVDRILLDDAAMTAIGGLGGFSNNDSRFWASAAGAAHDANDRVVYNTTTGQLWYDRDGTGAGIAQLIATLQDDPTLLASQIIII